MIKHLQTHVCSPRCRKKTTAKCSFGFQMPISDKTEIVDNEYIWKRGRSDVNIVPHNLN